jgi:hypothetical protein
MERMSKIDFVDNFGRCLAATSFGIKGAYYENRGYEEVAIVEFINRDPLEVNITCDSNMAIISDVTRAIEEKIGY